MGGFSLGSILPSLITTARAEDMASMQQEHQTIDQDAAMYQHLISSPDVPPQLKGPAVERAMSLLDDHGNLEDENRQKIGTILTGLAKSSMAQGAQGVAQRLQKIRDAAGFKTSPVPPGLQDPNMTIESGDQAAPAEAVTVGDVPPDVTNLPQRRFLTPTPALGNLQALAGLPTPPEANAQPPVPDIPFAPGAEPTPPGAPEEPTRRKLSLAGPQAATTVPYKPPLQPKPPPGPTPPPTAYPLLAQLAQTHLTRMQKFGRAMAAMGAGLQGRTWTSPENQLKAQIQAQQMMQALQQQQRLQRWYAGQQYGLTGDALARYALVGTLPSATAAGGLTGEPKAVEWANEVLAHPELHTPVDVTTAHDIRNKWDQESSARGLTIKAKEEATQKLPPETVRYWADMAVANGGLIPTGMARYLKTAGVAQIMDEIPKIAKERGMSIGDMLGQKADRTALQQSLNKMESSYAQVQTFEKTASQNLDRATAAGAKLIDTGSPLVNRPVREVLKELAGKPEYAAFDAAQRAAVSEVSKVLSGSLGNGAVSDSARAEADKLLQRDYTLEQLIAVADMLKQDMETRTRNMQDTIFEIRLKIANPTPTSGMVTMQAPPGPDGTPGPTKQVPADQVEHYRQLGATIVK